MNQFTTPRPVSTLRVSPPNQRPFLLHCYTSKLAEKLAKYPGAVVLGETTTPADGIVPTHVGKSIQQEKAEKVAAKLASANQQRGTKREATKSKRVSAKPPKLLPSKPPKLAKTPKLTRAKSAAPPRDAKPCVCLTTGTYFPTLVQAQASMKKANRALQQSLSRNGGVARYNKRVFAYATDAERAGKVCLRTVADVVVPPGKTRGNQHIARPIRLIATGEVFGTVAAFARANHTAKKWLIHIAPGEIRQTPVGAVRLATKSEVEEWKLNRK